jgi:hypothetical protein
MKAKPGSKTRSRRTLGGGTKTVTRTKSSTGAKTRTVERSKGNYQTNTETRRKVRRADKSGVTKTKDITFMGQGVGNDDYATKTLQTKNTYRKRGKLGSEKRDLKQSYRGVNINKAIAVSDVSSKRKKPTLCYKFSKSDRDNVKYDRMVEKTGKDQIKRVRETFKSKKNDVLRDKRSAHNMATKYMGLKNKPSKPLSNEGVETGRTYTPKRK